MQISPLNLEIFARQTLEWAGLQPDDAAQAADALVMTDTWGVHTHGTKNLRGYIRRLRDGGLTGAGKACIEREGPAWAIVDGMSGLAMNTSLFAMDTAIRKARTTGVGYVGVHNSCHFGAAGIYAARAAAEGLIGIAMANDTPTVSVPGSRTAVLGSNPLAIAIPSHEPFPILLDIATSTVAGGKVFHAASAGQRIPEGWIIDANGSPTTDPTFFPNSACLTPMSGHKGYGIALWIETLSAVLTGAAMGAQVLSWSFGAGGLPTNHGAAFLAIDIGSIQPVEVFRERIRILVEQIRTAPRAPGVDRILLPGEREWQNRQKALRDGMELPDDVAKPLRQLSAESGVAL